MNPFESIAGRKISRSTGAFCSWAWADATKPVDGRRDDGRLDETRRGRTSMNTSGRTGARTSGSTELSSSKKRRPFITASRSESKRYPASAHGFFGDGPPPAARRRRRADHAARAPRRGRAGHPPRRRLRSRARSPRRRWSARRCAWGWRSRRWRCRSPSARCRRGGGCRGSAAPARDEREAAIALATRGPGRRRGLRRRALAVVDFGGVALAADAAGSRERLPAGRVGAGEPGERAARRGGGGTPRARSRDSRRLPMGARAAAARRGRAGLRLARRSGSPPGSRPAPARRELAARRSAGLAGRGLGPGRLSVLAALGLPVADERLRALAQAAVLVDRERRRRPRPGYLPGLGERDARVAALAPPAGSAHHPRRADATDAEIAAALSATQAG